MDSDQRKARLGAFKAMSLGDLRDCATEMYRILREDDANLDALRARVKALEAQVAALTEDVREAYREAWYRGQCLQCAHGHVIVQGDWVADFDAWQRRLSDARAALAAADTPATKEASDG